MTEIVGAYILDLIVGDPRWVPHPVRWMGGVIERGEGLLRRLSPWEGISGAVLTISLVVLSYFFTKWFLWALYIIHPLIKPIVETIIIFFAISIKDLSDHAKDVYRALCEDKDIKAARRYASMMVGRKTSHLPEEELIRATVESVAENTVDGVLSPLFYAMIGGAPLALTYKMVNTLDAMIGHKDIRYKRFGFLAAKVDDAFNFIPARISLLLIPLASFILRKNFKDSFLTALKDHKKHPSPNAGIPEGAVAGALGLRLGGVNYYGDGVERRPYIGRKTVDFLPQHIMESVDLMRTSSILILISGILLKEVLLGWVSLRIL